jgi:hypothetical protein
MSKGRGLSGTTRDPTKPSGRIETIAPSRHICHAGRAAQKQLRRRLRQQMAFDESLPARKSRQQRKSPAGIDA